MMQVLRKRVRVRMGQELTPGAGVIDSQTVKTTQKGARGNDEGKNVEGRKRQVLVGTQELILHVRVHLDGLRDHAGGKRLRWPRQGRFPRMPLLCADRGDAKGGFPDRVAQKLGWKVEIVEHPWSGLRGVWAPEGTTIDGEQVRPGRLPCRAEAPGGGAHGRLAVHMAPVVQTYELHESSS